MKEAKQNAGFMKKLHANILSCKPTEIYNIKQNLKRDIVGGKTKIKDICEAKRLATKTILILLFRTLQHFT